ncbi:MAG: phage holin family protein [Rhodothermales bacterium]
MNLLLRWLVGALALLLVAYLLPGIAVANFFPAAVVAALVLGLVNAFIRPLVKLLTLPLTCLTLGLFSLVINAALFWAVAAFVDGFAVEGAVAALLGSLAYSLVTAAASAVLK